LTSQSDRVYKDGDIRAPKVLCIDSEGKNLGVIPTYEALKIATDQGLNLVQMAAPAAGRPPTAKILDYGKLKFDQSKKQKASEKKQRESEVKVKEMKFRPVTGANDLQIKAKKVEEFLAEGSRVKVSIVFRGREMSHRDVAIATLEEFMSMIPNGQITSQPAVEGKALSIMIDKKEEG
jgi:translation initiation factor IF-3